MTQSQTAHPRDKEKTVGNHSLSTVMAFVLGIPIGIGLLLPFSEISFYDFPVYQGPWVETEMARYLSHPVEKITVILFACALGAMLSKLVALWSEKAAFRRGLLPPWEGQPLPVESAGHLLDEFQQHSRRLRNTLLGRRIASVLEFVGSRRSANDLDDHLRGLADNDDIALDGSYSLIRFITWAIPILGFLGTVLGITGAISGVSPEVLEKSLNTVTDGLALAFDTTAVALMLTMVAMFFSFMTERLEQNLLEKVNSYTEEQLAHRFERSVAESSEFTDVVRRNTQAILDVTEKLVQKQASLWQQSLEEARKHWQASGQQHQEQLSQGLELALSRTLQSHAELLTRQEEKSFQSGAVVMDQIQNLSMALANNAQQQQTVLAQLVQRVTEQTRALVQLADSGTQLAQLQQLLQQNLQVLAGAGAFEQAVGSLTAAIHLLTTRVKGSPQVSLPGVHRSGEAA